MDIYLEKEVEKVRKVDPNKRYWFVRTYGGEIYHSYYEGNYIGLGLNNVPMKYIKEAKEDEYNLRNFIEKNTDYKLGSITRWVNQLIDFEHEVKIGDTVIIPDKNSDRLSIGIVESDVYIESKTGTFRHGDETVEYPQKRRRVKWERTIPKESIIQTDLKNLISSQYGITNANRFAETIEGYVSSVFIKDDKAYLVIKINQDEEINAFALNNFLSSLTFFYHEYCRENGEDVNDELFIKIKLQSKGGLALKAVSIGALVAVSTLFALSDSVHLKLDLRNQKIDASSDGLLKSLTNFLDANEKRRERWALFQDSLAQLKAVRADESIKSNQEASNEVKKEGKQKK